jgi:hypothetical protein
MQPKTAVVKESVFQQNLQKKILKDLKKWIFFSSDHGFCEENFFARMQCPKNS